ncbi:MAG: rhodanese-like domain-containing protein [Opitutales bacterium]
MNLLFLIGTGLVLFLVVRTVRLARSGLSPAQAQAALKAGTAVLIDVREPGEWAGGVAQDAALLPLSDLRGPRRSWQPFLEKNRGKQLLLYCASGARSGYAARLLAAEGLHAVNTGGLGGWRRSGWTVGAPRGRR